MLLRLGIASSIYRERRQAGRRLLPDGHGGRRLYDCRANHELVIAGENLRTFAEQIGFEDVIKRARLQAALSAYKRKLNREQFIATVESVEPNGCEAVYDVEIPGANAFDANGIYVHNCGELPLPPYGACDLGSINLTAFVRGAFTERAALDLDAVTETVRVAVRMMDNVVDVSRFPLPRQAEMAHGTRRIGLGLTGLADTLILLGLHYAEPPARELAARAMQTICHAAYRASIELAHEKGPFPYFERDAYLAGEYIRSLPADIRDGIDRHGIRNSHVTAIAPTGTISLLANNVSSGIEPVYDFRYRRRVLELDGTSREHELRDYAVEQWRALHGDAPLARAFVSARALPPTAHLDMQAALQPFVDNSISKTINVPADFPFERFKDIYRYAFDRGLKGCTTYRPNTVTGAVLEDMAQESKLCCVPEREAD
jgi:ribonucleoside-diphosphate reductase alpha chain